jgi:hypothetical protein
MAEEIAATAEGIAATEEGIAAMAEVIAAMATATAVIAATAAVAGTMAAAVAATANAKGQAEVTGIEMHIELMLLVEYNGRPLFMAELSGRPSVTKKVQRSLDGLTEYWNPVGITYLMNPVGSEVHTVLNN